MSKETKRAEHKNLVHLTCLSGQVKAAEDGVYIEGFANKNIVDLFNFCGNRYMWDSLDDNDNVDSNTHHKPEQYKHLENYLLTYINQ